VLTQGGVTVASQGTKFEETVAIAMNAFFEEHDLAGEKIAKAAGGSGHGDDVEIRNHNGKLEQSFEVKRSKGSRVDFGQFRLYYDPTSGWGQATGEKNKVVNAIFQEIKPTLDEEVRPSSAPYGPSFTDVGAQEFWDSFEPNRSRSLSGDVFTIPVSKNLIQDYYEQKGNDFIILGNDIYSLSNDKILPVLEKALNESYILFRIKYHGPNYSYTAALRGSFIDTEETDFQNALKKIFLT